MDRNGPIYLICISKLYTGKLMSNIYIGKLVLKIWYITQNPLTQNTQHCPDLWGSYQEISLLAVYFKKALG